MARILMISERALSSAVGRSPFIEFEDVVCAMDDVHLVAPEAAKPSESGRLRRFAQAQLERWLGVRVTFVPTVRTYEVEDSYDLAFVFVTNWSGGALEALRRVTGWRKRCRLAVCWIHEVWADRIRSLRPRQVPTALREFDEVIVGLERSVGPMSELLGRECRLQPGGIDAITFCPYPDPPERLIDVYNMGRRSPETHQALLEWARRERRHYLFDTLSAQGLLNNAEHRWMLANTLKRTRFFVANRAQVNKPQITGGQQEVGLRFFEGAAAGTVMIGEPPVGCATFEDLFSWPDALVPVPFGSTRMGEVIEQLERSPERLECVRRQNVRQSLLRFDWLYAWREILRLARMDPLDGLVKRELELRRLARVVESSAASETHMSMPER